MKRKIEQGFCFVKVFCSHYRLLRLLDSSSPEIVSESVLRATAEYPEIMAAKIDSQYMNGKDLSDHYGTNPDDGANCIVVRGKDGQTAAVLAPVGHRADLNGIVREKLGTNVSMAPLDEVLEATGMEYGSITPISLPKAWKILIDSRLMKKEKIIVGGGKQISKLLVPTTIFKDMSAVMVVEGLSEFRVRKCSIPAPLR